MPRPRLRPMTPVDVEPVGAAMAAAGWGDRRAWFRFAVATPACHVVAAEAPDGAIVGTGVATINGPVAWIGTIWVAPAWRRQGLGTALTQATIDAAEDADGRTLVLVATDEGRPLYERLGFEVQAWYRTVEAPGLGPLPEVGAVGSVRAYRPADLATMAALDRTATGEDRRHLLEAFATPDSARVVVGADGAVRGFVVRATWGGGATIAPDVDDAMALLEARRHAAPAGARVRAGVLDLNVDGLARLAAAGWTEAWRAPRLVRGAPLDWHPTAIWGQFNHAVG